MFGDGLHQHNLNPPPPQLIHHRLFRPAVGDQHVQLFHRRDDGERSRFISLDASATATIWRLIFIIRALTWASSRWGVIGPFSGARLSVRRHCSASPYRRLRTKKPSISSSVLPLVSGNSFAATRKKTTVQPAQKKNMAA